MNLRPLSLTVAVLVALCGAAWFVQRPAPPVSADPRIGQSVLAADLATKAAQVQLTDQGKTVALARRADGTWIVPSYYDFPADFSKLTQLVSDLTAAKIQRLVTTRSDRLGRLEFKDAGVKLNDDAGKELWALALGKNAEGGGRFVRYGAEEKGYQANLNLWLDVEAKNWANAVLLDLKPDDVSSLAIGFADGTSVTAARAKKEDQWTAADAPAGKRIKVPTITSILGNFGGLRFSDTTALDDEKAVAARAQGRTLKLTTFDGKSYTVTLGRKPEEKKPKAPAPEAKPADPTATEKKEASADKPAEPEKPKEPEMETIPAGPVFVSIAASDEKAPINTLMSKRAFEIGDWVYTGLPASPADLWEDVPPPPAPAPAEAPKATATTPPLEAKPAETPATPTN